MEPADLSSPDPTDQKLAAFLRSAEGQPLPDDGFSVRVLAALPPPRPAPWLSRRDWLSGGLAAGLLLLLAPGIPLADFSTFTVQAGDSAVGLLNNLVEDPVALTVIALTVIALLLTSPEEAPLLDSL